VPIYRDSASTSSSNCQEYYFSISCIENIIILQEYNGSVHQLFIDFKKAYNSIWREVLYNILTEFCVTISSVRLIKACLIETYTKAHKDKWSLMQILF
jgi:hypothetical protein